MRMRVALPKIIINIEPRLVRDSVIFTLTLHSFYYFYSIHFCRSEVSKVSYENKHFYIQVVTDKVYMYNAFLNFNKWQGSNNCWFLDKF